jgi:NAD(P)-dependent dehydrogenase (short-subunit alcohol dehydrogenase family)
MQVAGKTVFITGAAGGIGAGMAEAFVEAGASVVIADIDRDLAEATAAELGSTARALRIDVTSFESWAEARTAVGPVDILCNNAGIATDFEPLIDLDPDTFERVMAINVGGVYKGIRTFVPEMQARGSGHVVNTSSTNGLLPHGTFAAYSASKFAVLGLSDSLRQELEPHNVGVSVLFPGLTRSRMSEGLKVRMGMDDVAWAAFSANMMEPVWLGRAVVRAVEGNLPYIISHPDHGPMLERRHAAIMAAHGDPAQPGYGASEAALGYKD